MACSNGAERSVQGDRPYALASVLYDVLNRMGVDAILGKADADEVDLAVGHLAHTRPGDLLLMDRNDPSYRMLAELTQRQRHFAIRCSGTSFALIAVSRGRRLMPVRVGSGADWPCL